MAEAVRALLVSAGVLGGWGCGSRMPLAAGNGKPNLRNVKDVDIHYVTQQATQGQASLGLMN